MTVVVTRNVPDRYRGFLASCMLEIAPGVYTSPNLSRAVRERVWAVCCDWAGELPDDGGVLINGGPLDRCLARAIFVIGPDDKVKHVQYVGEVTEHPNYEACLSAAQS